MNVEEKKKCIRKKSAYGKGYGLYTACVRKGGQKHTAYAVWFAKKMNQIKEEMKNINAQHTILQLEKSKDKKYRDFIIKAKTH